MTEYINTLIVTMIVSQLAIQLAPNKDDAKKYIKLVCSLVVMLCLFSPIAALLRSGSEFIGKVKDLFTVSESADIPTDKYGSAAATLMTYISNHYCMDVSNVRITFITNETDEELLEIHVFVYGSSDITADKIENELSKELAVPIYVFKGAE